MPWARSHIAPAQGAKEELNFKLKERCRRSEEGAASVFTSPVTSASDRPPDLPILMVNCNPRVVKAPLSAHTHVPKTPKAEQEQIMRRLSRIRGQLESAANGGDTRSDVQEGAGIEKIEHDHIATVEERPCVGQPNEDDDIQEIECDVGYIEPAFVEGSVKHVDTTTLAASREDLLEQDATDGLQRKRLRDFEEALRQAALSDSEPPRPAALAISEEPDHVPRDAPVEEAVAPHAFCDFQAEPLEGRVLPEALEGRKLSEPLEERVRTRAYYLWLERRSNDSEADYLEALQTELALEATAQPPVVR